MSDLLKPVIDQMVFSSRAVAVRRRGCLRREDACAGFQTQHYGVGPASGTPGGLFRAFATVAALVAMARHRFFVRGTEVDRVV